MIRHTFLDSSLSERSAIRSRAGLQVKTTPADLTHTGQSIVCTVWTHAACRRAFEGLPCGQSLKQPYCFCQNAFTSSLPIKNRPACKQRVMIYWKLNFFGGGLCPPLGFISGRYLVIITACVLNGKNTGIGFYRKSYDNLEG